MNQTGAACRLEVVQQGGRGKVERASAYQSLCELGKVYIPLGSMGDETVAQTVAFPFGKHDDLIDADSLLPRLRSHAAFVAPTVKKRSDDDYIGANHDGDSETSTSNSF